MIVIPYRPRPVFLPYHKRVQRFAVGVAHRRCGKTVATINDMLRRALISPKEAYRAAYVAPFRSQAKRIAWDYLQKYSLPVRARKPNQSELTAYLPNGAQIALHGADNPDALRGAYLDDVVLDEYGDMHPGLWGTVIRPMLADRIGSATFIGTPRGKNDFYARWQFAKDNPEGWHTFLLRAGSTGILSPAELAAARAEMTHEEYEQEFECSFEAAIKGAYFGREMQAAEKEGRIPPTLPIEPGIPVHTAWDFGHGANMAVWCFQILPGPWIHLVDFVSEPGWYFADYLKDVNHRGYHGIDYVPHDAAVPDFTSGRTRIQLMIDAGRKPAEPIPAMNVDEGINAAKLTLPKCRFAADTCAMGIEGLQQYRQEYDAKLKVFRNTPRHDWASHIADAFRYLALSWRALIPPENPAKKRLRGMNEITFGEWVDDYDALV